MCSLPYLQKRRCRLHPRVPRLEFAEAVEHFQRHAGTRIGPNRLGRMNRGVARHVDFLHQHGCDAAQGYFFARPVPREAMTRRLADRGLRDLGVALPSGRSPGP
jgi:hypothetical protein